MNHKHPTNIKKFGKGIFGDHYGFIKKYPEKWLYGADQTGDITKPRNIKWFRNYFSSSNLPHLSMQKNLYIYGLFLFLLFLVYNWNYHLDFEQNQIYIPHITKIFLFISFITYLTIRGFYIPLKKNIPLNFLLPKNFLLITLFSFMLDQVKSLSFFLGFLKKLIFDKKRSS